MLIPGRFAKVVFISTVKNISKIGRCPVRCEMCLGNGMARDIEDVTVDRVCKVVDEPESSQSVDEIEDCPDFLD